MKLMRMITMFFIIACIITACSNDDNPNVEMTNGVILSVVGNASMAEDDTEGINIHVLMAFAPNKDETIEIVMTGNESNIVRIDHNTLHFKAGQKEAIVKIQSNAKHMLSTPKTISIKVGKTSNPHIKAADEGVKITITPDSDMPVLTSKQLQLIEGYKQKYGFDITAMLGKVPVEATVSFNTADKESFFKGESQATFKGFSIITLSEKATEETPVLKMIENPMGLTSFFYDILKRKTVEDNEFFLQQPYGNAIVQAIAYDASKEQFSMTLDDIKLVPSSGEIEFIVQRSNAYDEMIYALPFVYYFSAWERVKKLRDEGTIIYVKENGKTVGYQITDEFLMAGGSIDPQRWLAVSDVSHDTFKNSPSDWIEPKGSFDFTNGTMSFVFPWDFDAANGYEQIRVTYTLQNKGL